VTPARRASVLRRVGGKAALAKQARLAATDLPGRASLRRRQRVEGAEATSKSLITYQTVITGQGEPWHGAQAADQNAHD